MGYNGGYPLVICCIAIEAMAQSKWWIYPLIACWFSIVFCRFTRGYQELDSGNHPHSWPHDNSYFQISELWWFSQNYSQWWYIYTIGKTAIVLIVRIVHIVNIYSRWFIKCRYDIYICDICDLLNHYYLDDSNNTYS